MGEVWLTNGCVEADSPYGKVVSYEDLRGLLRNLALAIARKPARLNSGEFLWLRRYVGVSQKDVANLVGRTEQAISLVERKKGDVPLALDREFRRLAIERVGGPSMRPPSVESMAFLTARTAPATYRGTFQEGVWNFVVEVKGTNQGRVVTANQSVQRNLLFQTGRISGTEMWVALFRPSTSVTLRNNPTFADFVEALPQVGETTRMGTREARAEIRV